SPTCSVNCPSSPRLSGRCENEGSLEIPHPWPDAPLACRDRDDAVFLHLERASGADVLVSGDADLGVLAGAYPVISPAMLRQRLEGAG
ncbi:MAG: hypothetical protein ACP5NP_16350, partial [Acetobacteraceae bacterium]